MNSANKSSMGVSRATYVMEAAGHQIFLPKGSLSEPVIAVDFNDQKPLRKILVRTIFSQHTQNLEVVKNISQYDAVFIHVPNFADYMIPTQVLINSKKIRVTTSKYDKYKL